MIVSGNPDFAVAVLGGGAAGIAAAISAARKGKSAVICERLGSLGKKILASGNGRCNLLNENLSGQFYNPPSRPLVQSVFEKFGKDDILKFFNGLGLRTYSEEGRIFPITNQSSSVLKILEIELKRLGIHAELNFEAAGISHSGSKFILTSSSGRKISAGVLVIASGGKSYPALGSDGSCYKFAKQFGHTVIEPVPSAVALTAKDPVCHILQGQKISACAKAVIGGSPVCAAKGEALFTKYGLSGTAILDISREISIHINRTGGKDSAVILDMIPFMSETELKAELGRRIENRFPSEDLIAGILPNKFALAFGNILKTKDAALITKTLKAKEFKITGTRSWNEADFTAGGVKADQLRPGTLESELKNGLYFAGEVIDVDGCRGGYNLAWAWASGFTTGSNI